MLRKQISLSPDLKRLQDEGYEIEVIGGYLLAHHVPYVNSRREIAYGTLVSKLELSNDKTILPVGDHVIKFVGERPCNHDGSMIEAIWNGSQDETLVEGVTTNHTFSSKPPSGKYQDYYEKIVSYERILSSQAQHIDPSPSVTAKTFKLIEADEPESPLHYIDTNSSRADIAMISAKLKNLKIAIIGLGGTGSYVLDLLSKTEIKEILIFDGDNFYQHNAFRSPGAATKAKLDEHPKKVAYLHGIYSSMHKGIIPHEYHLTPSNLDEILEIDFVFVCIDDGQARKQIVEKLLASKIPFIDVGIGIQSVNDLLLGCARVTLVTSDKNDHVSRRVSFADGNNAEYSQNIQIAELNALNAALAVIKMKKYFGIYHDLEKEYNSSYDTSVNKIINDETNQ